MGFLGQTDASSITPKILENMEAKLGEESLSNECKILALCGLGGMGKSQLMLRYCYLYDAQYNFKFWLVVEGRSTAIDSFRKLAINMGFGEANVKEASEEKVVGWI